MAQQNLIIGGFTNYGINELKPWVLSINEKMPDAHKVMCVGQASDETKAWLVEQGFELTPIPKSPMPIHVLRFFAIYEYLRKNHDKFKYVVTTDVKDVYFQADPFEMIDDICSNSGFKLILASEGLKYKDEPWGNDNLMQSYGPYIHELFKNNEIYNVGTFGGLAEYVKDMVFHIFTNAINRPIQICDQAVFNVLVNTLPFADVCYPTDDWACEAGTVADPTKIESFRPNLTCDEPTLQEGLVYYRDYLFPIVHQYDRVPEWKKIVQERYGQDDDSLFFKYKT